MIKFSFIGDQVAHLTCKIHHQHPRVVKNGNKVSIKCCCEEFRSEIKDQIPAIVDAYIKRTISDVLKKR